MSLTQSQSQGKENIAGQVKSHASSYECNGLKVKEGVATREKLQYWGPLVRRVKWVLGKSNKYLLCFISIL